MTIKEGPLSQVSVHEVMHTGILTTDADTPLRVVARLMAEQRVHVVAVASPDHVQRPFGVVSTLEIAKAVAEGIDETAGQATRGEELVTISSADPLEYAAQIMTEHKLTHLLVVDPATGHPTGVLSTLDIAAAYGR